MLQKKIYTDAIHLLQRQSSFIAFISALLVLLAPGITSAFFTSSPVTRCIWAMLSAIVGAGTVSFFSFLIPDRWKRLRMIVSGLVLFSLLLFTILEGISWIISSKTFSYEFSLHLSVNTLRYGISGYEWAMTAAVFYLAASVVTIGYFNSFPACTKGRMVGRSAGFISLILLLVLPTPSGAALRFWVVRPIEQQKKIVVTDEDYYRFGIKRNIPDRDNIRAVPGKNLVLVYLESTENSYLDQTRFPGLMPNTRALLKEAVVFEELQPSTNGVFTIGALFASQAGYDLTDLHLAGRFGNDGINPAVGNRLCSMPGVLKKAGYFLSFMASNSLNFASTKVILTEFGYDDLWAAEDLPQKIRQYYGFTGEWGGCRDSMLFRIGAEKFRTLSELHQPFLLTLMTIDAHHPDGVASSAGPVYALPGEEPSQLLTAIHRTDLALGEFVANLKRHPAWKNTILFVMSDHLAMNGASTIRMLRKNPHRRLLAFALNAGMPRRITVKGKTFDLAPTFLELAGVQHNNIFPLGESLLGQPNPRRLYGDIKLAQPAMETLLQKESGYSSTGKQDEAVRVVTSPYAALKINGVLMPIFSYYTGDTTLPSEKECYTVRLSPENRAVLWQRFKRAAPVATFLEDGQKTLLFGPASGPAGVLTGLVDLPPDDYILAIQENGKFRTVHGPNPEELALPL